MPPVSRSIRLLALVLGVLISLSAIGIGGTAATLPAFAPGQRPAWMLLGFEIVVLVSGALAVLFGRGRFSEGPGLALACISGTVFIASGFGWISASKQLGGVSLTPLLAFRFVCGGLLAAAGAVCVLSRNPRSWRIAALGVVLGAPCFAVVGAAVLPGGRRALMNVLAGGGMIQTVAAIVGVVILGGLLCASVHLLIKAFDMGAGSGR